MIIKHPIISRIFKLNSLRKDVKTKIKIRNWSKIKNHSVSFTKRHLKIFRGEVQIFLFKQIKVSFDLQNITTDLEQENPEASVLLLQEVLSLLPGESKELPLPEASKLLPEASELLKASGCYQKHEDCYRKHQVGCQNH